MLSNHCSWVLGDGKRAKLNSPKSNGVELSIKNQALWTDLVREGTYVNYLLDERGRWDDAKVDMVFQDESAKCVKSMIPGVEDLSEEIVWPHTRRKIYTVKSGYETIFLHNCAQALDGRKAMENGA